VHEQLQRDHNRIKSRDEVIAISVHQAKLKILGVGDLNLVSCLEEICRSLSRNRAEKEFHRNPQQRASQSRPLPGLFHALNTSFSYLKFRNPSRIYLETDGTTAYGSIQFDTYQNISCQYLSPF